MKYFLHDSNALQDEKLTKLFMAYGYEGTGLFFAVLERLAFHEKAVDTAVLKKQLRVGKKLEKCWAFMETIELISTKNGETFNERLLKFGEKFDKIRENNRERQAKHREYQDDTKNVTRDKQKRNGPNSTVEYSNEDNTNSTDAPASDEPDLFEQFWDAYDLKEGRKKCKAKFDKLPLKEKQAILENVPEYVKKHPNPDYRKHPLSYLNGECWKDPIQSSTQQASASNVGQMVY